GSSVAVGGDLRPSTPRIMAAAAKAIIDSGLQVINCGPLPSPALALYGIAAGVPSVMVTGSHIPDDRNGIKYNTAAGEITKDDEAGITSQRVSVPDMLFDVNGSLADQFGLPEAETEARVQYVQRYLGFFSQNCLAGKKVALYEHSSVAREVLGEIFEGLGAQVDRFGFSDAFIPVDTEAIRDEDIALARIYASEHDVDCIISADGDGDRPLISDEHGEWLRGDVAGILCAHYLRADAVVTPVSCNSALEKSGFFREVSRTRIGSPYVIAGMQAAIQNGSPCVVGYEANGGFLLGTALSRFDEKLAPLMTRDAAILQICIVLLSIQEKTTISNLAALLPQRFTASDRLKNFPTDISRNIISSLCADDETSNKKEIKKLFGALSGSVLGLDNTDGLRARFDSDEIIHLRPSGNAPEFRCYTEAATPERAIELNKACIEIMKKWQE
ncbi:MAG: phosphomannomutase, partial [Deltaproteobacteria bacterium]|nr:phosphomannomutase [Deltaproteobacteria bacterium]